MLKLFINFYHSRQESVIGEKELLTVVTWFTSSVKLTHSSSSMRSLLPPLAGRAIGTGTVSVFCFTRGEFVAFWRDRLGFLMNCSARDCDKYRSMLYHVEFLWFNICEHYVPKKYQNLVLSSFHAVWSTCSYFMKLWMYLSTFVVVFVLVVGVQLSTVRGLIVVFGSFGYFY